MAPYRITRMSPGQWVILNRLTGMPLAVAPWQDCIALWAGGSTMRLKSSPDEALAALDAALSSIPRIGDENIGRDAA